MQIKEIYRKYFYGQSNFQRRASDIRKSYELRLFGFYDFESNNVVISNKDKKHLSENKNFSTGNSAIFKNLNPEKIEGIKIPLSSLEKELKKHQEELSLLKNELTIQEGILLHYPKRMEHHFNALENSKSQEESQKELNILNKQNQYITQAGSKKEEILDKIEKINQEIENIKKDMQLSIRNQAEYYLKKQNQFHPK